MVIPLQTAASVAGVNPSTQVERIDPFAGDRWDSLVTPRADHSIFHRSAWARVLAETYGHRPFYLSIVAAGAGEALVPLMEVNSPVTGRRGVSLPFADFAGPLWSAPHQASEAYEAMLELAKERKWKRLEIRGDASPPPGVRSFRSYHAHELDLSQGIEAIEKKLHSSARRSIQKSERSGLELAVRRDPAAVREFYHLHSHTRRRHGLPPQPFGFFEAIGRHVIEPGLGDIVLAHRGGTPVAGAVFFHSGGRAIYKFGASDTAFWELRPNHLVMWAAIRHLAANGCRSLHFGRTSAGDDGLNRFKQSWSAACSSLDYFRHDPVRSAWVTETTPPSESHPLIFGRLPISINRVAGRLIYPHLD
jgi:CelD/BcsL family acetyltransferase involved in cellulose biosynthesis